MSLKKDDERNTLRVYLYVLKKRTTKERRFIRI